MPTPPSQPSPERRTKLLAELRRDQTLRARSYRGRALKIFPHVCASCGRELEGKRLRELTVHHKDHDHTNNPNDGSNWELLCIYCHDDEHEKYLRKGHGGGSGPAEPPPTAPGNPFDSLDSLLTPTDKPNE